MLKDNKKFVVGKVVVLFQHFPCCVISSVDSFQVYMTHTFIYGYIQLIINTYTLVVIKSSSMCPWTHSTPQRMSCDGGQTLQIHISMRQTHKGKQIAILTLRQYHTAPSSYDLISLELNKLLRRAGDARG